MFSLALCGTGFTGAQLFYAARVLPLGYLVFKSGFLPKALGIILMRDCLTIGKWFFQFPFLSGNPAICCPCWVVSFIAEFSLVRWLVIMGITE